MPLGRIPAGAVSDAVRVFLLMNLASTLGLRPRGRLPLCLRLLGTRINQAVSVLRRANSHKVDVLVVWILHHGWVFLTVPRVHLNRP